MGKLEDVRIIPVSNGWLVESFTNEKVFCKDRKQVMKMVRKFISE